ncbi:MAG: sel1 repeat family protein, partial [Desulfovibrionaceae bacterium]|nr:sel1 repeat family protein [Desulfovibrionaceae bacterium]
MVNQYITILNTIMRFKDKNNNIDLNCQSLEMLKFIYDNNLKYDDQVIAKIKETAEKGDSDSQLVMANYYNAKGLIKEFVLWCEKLAAQGNPYYQFLSGLYYFNDIQKTPDYEKSIRYFSQASSNDLKIALIFLGYCYKEGKGVSKDLHISLDCFLELFKNIDKVFEHLTIFDDFYVLKVFNKNSLTKKIGYSLKALLDLLIINNFNKNLPTKYINDIKRYAKEGNEYFQYILSFIYVWGIGVEVDFAQGYFWWLKSYENCFYQNLGLFFSQNLVNDFVAQKNAKYLKICNNTSGLLEKFNLSLIYLNDSILLNYKAKGLQLLKECVDDNFSPAQNILSRFYYYGQYVNEDQQKALELAIKSEAQNNADGLCFLGFLYLKDNSDSIKILKGIDLLKKSILLGSTEAYAILGKIFENDLRTEFNYSKAFTYYYKGYKSNNPESIYNLARCYERGIGAKINLNKAFSLYNLAAAQGSDEAQKYLQNFRDLDWYKYQSKFQYNYQYRDPIKTKIYFTLSKEFDCKSSFANKNLALASKDEIGLIHLSGCEYFEKYEVVNNFSDIAKKVFIWVKRAAELGLPSAQAKLAQYYLNGLGTEKNIAEFKSWAQKFLESNAPLGKTLWGIVNLSGIGVEKNEEEAVKWFKEAANQGDPTGMMFLSIAYKEGVFFEPNDAESFKWASKALLGGYTRAKTNLGLMFLTGAGVKTNINIALELLQDGALSGDKDAISIYKKLKSAHNVKLLSLQSEKMIMTDRYK